MRIGESSGLSKRRIRRDESQSAASIGRAESGRIRPARPPNFMQPPRHWVICALRLFVSSQMIGSPNEPAQRAEATGLALGARAPVMPTGRATIATALPHALAQL
jgi:hypothetical protein